MKIEVKKKKKYRPGNLTDKLLRLPFRTKVSILGIILLVALLSRLVPGWIESYEEKRREDPLAFLDQLKISFSEPHYQTILEKREEALDIGVLLTSDDDYVPATITFNGEEYEADIRLKGDWVDHLEDSRKWSYRIKLKGEQTILGMRKFSIQHPETRNYAFEKLYHDWMRREDLMNLRYRFVSVTLERPEQITDKSTALGLFALEESFDKRLIENCQRREGLILKFSEDDMWKDRALATKVTNPDAGYRFFDPALQKEGEVRVFSYGKVMETPGLREQFDVARNLLEGYRQGKLEVAEAFDIKKLAMFNALANLMGGPHSLISHNLRLYYNPITSRLEPISFDGNTGHQISNIDAYFGAGGDLQYLTEFASALEYVSSEDYIDDILEQEEEEMQDALNAIALEFPEQQFKTDVIYSNARFIRKNIFPAKAFYAHVLYQDNKKIVLQLRSLTRFPVSISGLIYEQQKLIAPAEEGEILQPHESRNITFNLPNSFNNLFVKKNRKKTGFALEEDYAKLGIGYRISGTSMERRESLVPYKEYDEDFKQKDLIRQTPNPEEFDFVSVNESKKEIVIRSGQRIMTGNMILPEGYTVIANEGLELDFQKGAKLISYSTIKFRGSRERPIKISSSDGSGQGILVMNTADTSTLTYTIFDGLGPVSSGNWSLPGSVNFYEANVLIDSCAFANNRSEDALNIVRSYFEMSVTSFENTRSDAFDGDFVKGKLSNAYFTRLGNDAIDVSGSELILENIEIDEASDKGLSAGERSTMDARNISIRNSEIGVASKDRSTIRISGLYLDSCQLGFTAFQKKPEYGPAAIESENIQYNEVGLEHLIEDRSELTIDGKRVKTSKEVLEKMYGIEFGKSSK